jgi:hypothetical protein
MDEAVPDSATVRRKGKSTLSINEDSHLLLSPEIRGE